MLFPTLFESESSRQVIDEFRGYNHNLRINDNEFYDMLNLTSDYYPVMSPRGNRSVYASPGNPQGMIEKDNLCYIDGQDFVMNEYRVNMSLSVDPDKCPKTLISMGAYVIIMPDKKYINTLDLTDYGEIEAEFTSISDVVFELCDINGDLYGDTTVSETEPSDPDNLALWIDTSTKPNSLKRYSSSTEMWVTIPTTYIKISSSGIGSRFEQYDGITISGVLDEKLQDLNTSTIIWAKDRDYIVVPGIIESITYQVDIDGPITVSRKMPNMDYITEAENRLWGCRYGVASNGEIVNEIYASKLGDFKNWNCFMGLSTDSWAASVGTDGMWTGATTLNGYPIFFKETCLHKIYISSSGAHQIQDTSCRGVQSGCERSLAIVNETLYYKARSGICAYDGSLPIEVSSALGNISYGNAVGCSHGSKYYVVMKDEKNDRYMFVYDVSKGMWHKEDSFNVLQFCSCRGNLYAIDSDSNSIVNMLCCNDDSVDNVHWMAQTGDIGMSSPDMKYVSRINIRMSLAEDSEIEIYAQYDFDGYWYPIAHEVGSTKLRSFSIPIRPRRCDNMRLKFVGIGDAKIYSITKTIEQGSDLS